MNIRNEIYNTIKEGLPIILPNKAQQERSGETYVLVTDLAPDNVKELAGDSRQAFIVSEEPLKISFPNSEEVIDVSPDAIVKESVSVNTYKNKFKPTKDGKYTVVALKPSLVGGVVKTNSPTKMKVVKQEAGLTGAEVEKWMKDVANKNGVGIYFNIEDEGNRVVGQALSEAVDTETETVVQTKTVSGRKVQIKKIGSGPAHKVYVEEDPAQEFPSADAAKSWLADYEASGGHFTYESKQVRNYVKKYLAYLNS
jgi:hypothetical protein